jgi:hypothetical protein
MPAAHGDDHFVANRDPALMGQSETYLIENEATFV